MQVVELWHTRARSALPEIHIDIGDRFTFYDCPTLALALTSLVK